MNSTPPSVLCVSPSPYTRAEPITFRSIPILPSCTTWFVDMVISLFDSHARELRTGRGHVPRESEQPHDGILVGGHALIAQRHEIPLPVWPEEEILRVAIC